MERQPPFAGVLEGFVVGEQDDSFSSASSPVGALFSPAPPLSDPFP